MPASEKPHNGRVLYLDGWRGLAIFSVLFGHFGTAFALNFGRAGVELFFVLSGRLMAELLFTQRVELSQFFPRRFSRVWPTLFIFSGGCLIFSALFTHNVRPIDFLAAITFTSNYLAAFFSTAPWLEHTWSLCIEEHSYILLGIIALLTRKYALDPIKIIIGLIIFAVTLGYVQTFIFDMDYRHVYWRSDVRGASILLGAAAFLVLNAKTPPRMLQAAWTPLFFTVAGFALQLNVVPDPIKYSFGTTCFAIAIATLNHARGPFLRALESKPAIFLGLTSYSLYIWQQPFYQNIGHKIPVAMAIEQRLIWGAAAATAAMISFYFIETPSRKYLNTLWARLSQKM
jgi:peptidoglycan/LPS O-acetylase OafA/YrhL